MNLGLEVFVYFFLEIEVSGGKGIAKCIAGPAPDNSTPAVRREPGRIEMVGMQVGDLLMTVAIAVVLLHFILVIAVTVDLRYRGGISPDIVAYRRACTVGLR